MRCLHVCNDFSLTRVHRNLYVQLDLLGFEQIIFNPVRDNTPVGRNEINFKQPSSKIIYSSLLKKFHRILFRSKVHYLFNNLDHIYDLNKIDVSHATTLFSDGAIALRIKKKYGTPYVVTVRATDVYLFMKYRLDLYWLAREILFEASSIVFISNSLQKKFFQSKWIKSISYELHKKSVVIYNGIDNFWLDNISPKKRVIPRNILYVGRMIGRKNPVKLIDAILLLNSSGIKCNLTLVGDGGDEEEIVRNKANENPETINYLGGIYDKDNLKKIFNQNDIFALPALAETFGLVYIEALSQGLPILYCQNESVDGVFDITVGLGCDNTTVEGISSGIKQIIEDYEKYQLDLIDFSIFRWDNIVHSYSKLYNSILKS